MTASATKMDVRARATMSHGTSEAAIYEMVASAVVARHSGGGTVVDVGCGAGNLFDVLCDKFDRYIGADVIRYPGFPSEAEFVETDLETGRIALPDESADVIVAAEVIEHLENPRAFARELARLVKPGGWVFITTPNQLSLLSLASLVLKGQFPAFADSNYPAHITALLEIDLKRIVAEVGLTESLVRYTGRGRILMTPFHYPRALSALWPRALSDNILVGGRARTPKETKASSLF